MTESPPKIDQASLAFLDGLSLGAGSYDTCVFHVYGCELHVPTDRVNAALKLAGLPYPVSFGTNIVLESYAGTPVAKYRGATEADKQAPKVLHVGAGWFMSWEAVAAERKWREDENR